MSKRLQRTSALFVCISVLISSGLAVASENVFEPPDFKAVDSRGVNLISGRSTFSQSPVSIGGSNGLTFTLSASSNRFDRGGDMTHNFYGRINTTNTGLEPSPVLHPGHTGAFVAILGSKSTGFIEYGTTFESYKSEGETFVWNGGSTFTWTWRDGTKVHFETTSTSGSPGGTPYKIEYPNGLTIDIHRQVVGGLIRSVTSNTGYQLKYSYDGSHRLTSVVALNRTVDYCSPAATTCNYSRTWPQASLAYATVGGALQLTVTDMAGLNTRYTHITRTLGAQTDQVVSAVRHPTSSINDTVEYEYENMWVCTSGYGGLPGSCSFTRLNLVYRVHVGTATWAYSHQPAPPYNYDSRSTDPNGRQLVVLYNKDIGNLVRIDNPDGSWATFSSDIDNRMTKAVFPEGNEIRYLYDSRGNITEERKVPKTGSSLPHLVSNAGFDTTCSNRKKCNKPNWVRDARGNQTDFLYHASSGQIEKATQPADANGVRPQTRYSYIQRYAYIKTFSGSFVSTGQPIWLLDEESYCRKSAATATGCTQAGDEVTISYDYGPSSGANNLHLRGKVVTADGQSLRTCFGYDALGNKISETLPKAGLTSCP